MEHFKSPSNLPCRHCPRGTSHDTSGGWARTTKSYWGAEQGRSHNEPLVSMEFAILVQRPSCGWEEHRKVPLLGFLTTSPVCHYYALWWWLPISQKVFVLDLPHVFYAWRHFRTQHCRVGTTVPCCPICYGGWARSELCGSFLSLSLPLSLVTTSFNTKGWWRLLFENNVEQCRLAMSGQWLCLLSKFALFPRAVPRDKYALCMENLINSYGHMNM